MRRIALVSVLLLLCATPLSAIREADPHDGYWWLESPDSFKLGYVIGLSDGVSHCDLTFNALGDRLISDSTSLADCANILLLYREFLLYLNMEGVTYGQMMNGISTLYEDYRNKGLPAISLLPIVELQVAGISEAEIDSALQELRQIHSEAK